MLLHSDQIKTTLPLATSRWLGNALIEGDDRPYPAWRVHNYSPSNVRIKPKLNLTVPSYGVVFMNPPEDARTYAQLNGVEPTYDHLLNGNLVIELPPEYPQIRCKSICIRFEAVSYLNMGLGRGEEEDLLFERQVKIEEGQEGFIVEHGQKFAFSIILPSTLAPREWVSDGVVSNYLYAKVEGLPLLEATPLQKARSKSPPIFTRSRSNSPPNDRPRTSLFSALTRHKGHVPIPQPPTYVEEAGDWLQGVHTAIMVIRLIYNPDPAGGVNVLKEELKGAIPGLGTYDVHMLSDVWAISGLVKVNVALCDLCPGVTVYSLRVILEQTHHIRSPRDSLNGKEVVGTRKFILADKGHTPEARIVHPPKTHPALWRGADAGGQDDGPLIVELQCRISENDYEVRPSTLPSVETPVRISHVLEVDVYFSIHGTDAVGGELRISGPGATRVIRIRKSVMLPSCGIQPNTVTLPDYQHPESEDIRNDSLHPWRVCACNLSMETIVERMQETLKMEELAAREAEAAAPHFKE